MIQNLYHQEFQEWWQGWWDMVIEKNEVLMEPFIGTQWVRFCSRHWKENLDTNVHNKIGFISFSKAATKQDSNVAWILRETWCAFEQFKETLVVWQFNRNWWIMYSFRTIGKNWSITEVLFTIRCLSRSLDLWQEEEKVKEEDKLFSSRLLIRSEVMHMNKEEPSEDYSRPRKVLYQSRWRGNQVAVHRIKLSRTRDLGLQFRQTTSNAIIAHQSVPYQNIDRVIGDNGGRVVFQRILTPRLGPRITLRDTWAPQHQQKKAAAAATKFTE